MPDTDLISLLQMAAMALDEEAAWLVGIDTDDEGGSRPVVPARDIGFFADLTEEAQSIRELIAAIQARRTR